MPTHLPLATPSRQGAYAGAPVFDHNKCQIGAPRPSYGKQSGVVTKGPNGTKLTKGDYGYGVPMAPQKPEATYSSAPWGTDPVTHPAAAPAPFQHAQQDQQYARHEAQYRDGDDQYDQRNQYDQYQSQQQQQQQYSPPPQQQLSDMPQVSPFP